MPRLTPELDIAIANSSASSQTLGEERNHEELLSCQLAEAQRRRLLAEAEATSIAELAQNGLFDYLATERGEIPAGRLADYVEGVLELNGADGGADAGMLFEYAAGAAHGVVPIYIQHTYRDLSVPAFIFVQKSPYTDRILDSQSSNINGIPSAVGTLGLRFSVQNVGASFHYREILNQDCGWRTGTHPHFGDRHYFDVRGLVVTEDPERVTYETKDQHDIVSSRPAIIAFGVEAVSAAIEAATKPNGVMLDKEILLQLVEQLTLGGGKYAEFTPDFLDGIELDHDQLTQLHLAAMVEAINQKGDYVSRHTALPIVGHGVVGRMLDLEASARADVILEAITLSTAGDSQASLVDPGRIALQRIERDRRYPELHRNRNDVSVADRVCDGAQLLLDDIANNPVFRGFEYDPIDTGIVATNPTLMALVAASHLANLKSCDRWVGNFSKEARELKRIINKGQQVTSV